MMRVSKSSMSSGVVVNDTVSIRIRRSLIACGPEELREHAEQDVVLAGDVDRVAGRVGLVPVGAKHLLPAADHVHPMSDLGLRRPGDALLQQW